MAMPERAGVPVLKISEDNVRLGGEARDKTEAIRLVGQLMAESGFIEPGYIDSMLGREQMANTYLGNGIAIPHGLPTARDMVRRTGIAVVQFPAGVDWGGGQAVHVAVGIAAKSDEHIQVLANLTAILGDEAAARRLAITSDRREVAAYLNGEVAAAAPADITADEGEYPLSFTTKAPAPHGLHARPATMLVETAKGFDAEIQVRHGEKTANGKSLISLLRLGAGGGAALRIAARGSQAAEALQALRAAIDAGLGEGGEAAAEPRAEVRPGGITIPAYEGRVLAGVSASPGIALGPVWQFRREALVVAEHATDPAAQQERLAHALAGAEAELRNLHEEFWKKAGAAKAAIFKAHLELLDDPEMVSEARQRIDGGESAGWAWRAVYEDRATMLGQLKDPLLAARAADLRDAGRRVLRLLADHVEGEATLPYYPVILLAEDLSPSDTAKLDPRQVLGLCTSGGGATSHTAIIARSLDIPSVVACGPALEDIANGADCILDGESGVLVVEPSGRDRDRARESQTASLERREAERRDCYLPAITHDGRRVEVAANISDPAEAKQAVDAGGEGIGLTRTEFLFLHRNEPPGEEEQYEAYRTMVAALNGLPLILRSLDIGGDKGVPYLNLPAESNPFLGVRGIRLCLQRQDLFRTQLRAVFRASREGPVRLMYPMVATLDELAQAKAVTEEVRREVGADPIETGIMIEIPAAAMMADLLAREVDFFSIGTNDLTQYVLAMDRLHPVLAPQADGLHPAVLRMVERTAQAARAAGIWTGACGGIAGDPAGAVILAGLGVTELSVSIPSIAAVKALLRGISMKDAEILARRALTCRNAAEVRSLVQGLTQGSTP